MICYVNALNLNWVNACKYLHTYAIMPWPIEVGDTVPASWIPLQPCSQSVAKRLKICCSYWVWLRNNIEAKLSKIIGVLSFNKPLSVSGFASKTIIHSLFIIFCAIP